MVGVDGTLVAGSISRLVGVEVLAHAQIEAGVWSVCAVWAAEGAA